jgi:16S rRNA (cytidine1402-2'-O)-methyltransferase
VRDDAGAGVLVVCATPIGNLGDLTERVREALVAAEVVACEDTRRTRPLLTHIGSTARTLSLHEHNEQARAGSLVAEIAAGRRICLVSDAGLPAVSDPGRALISAVLDAGLPVEVLPGASAVTTALVASGLAADRFAFLGFLPRGPRKLAEVLDATDPWDLPLVCFEAPGRLPGTLRILAGRAPTRRLAVCRELTKRFEEVVRGPAAEVAERFQEPPKGEITLVLDRAGPSVRRTDDEAVDEAIASLARGGLSVRDSADLLARLTGASRRDLYERVLERRG